MNNTNDRLDCLIGLAMFDYAKGYEEEYDAIDTSDVVIDERFDKRIYRLIGKKEREPKVKKIKKISFRVAVAATAYNVSYAFDYASYFRCQGGNMECYRKVVR